MTRPARLQRRLMIAFAGFVLFTAALFGLYAMAFMYSVEDSFFNTMLAQEAGALERQHARDGDWGEPRDASMRLYRDTASLPDDLRAQYQDEPQRREFSGRDGRHYHVLPIDPATGARVWLVAEVSAQLVVRPMRTRALTFLGASGLVVVALALAIGLWIARRTAGPLARLAALVDATTPDALPRGVAAGFRDDEVGTLARGIDALIGRIDAFVTREREFTRDASHELRTPLAVIRSAAERLSAGADLDAAARERVSHIRQSALQLEQTVTTLLALAREEQRGDAPAERVAVLPLLERVVIEQSPLLAGKPVTVDVAVPADVRVALPVPVLNILLANLVGNAFAHTAAGLVRVDVEDDRLRVANSGDGSGPARRWRAPQPFDRSDGSAGYGLGLVILRRLCDRYGIDLRIDSADDGVVASVGLLL